MLLKHKPTAEFALTSNIDLHEIQCGLETTCNQNPNENLEP